MASAAVTFIRTFGMDEPMGCYDDFENADVFVLWGSNMAEMHPILWTRITDRRISAPHVRIHTLSTYEHRTTDLSDATLIFKPGTDLAILNYIANYIVQTNAVNRDFVDKHVNFRVANTDIGYGLRPEHVLEQRALHANDAQVSQPSSFDAYAKMLSEYTLDRVSDLSGVSKERLEALAKAYADPKTKVMSLWTMGFNQHVRGVWANHLVYNIHLLTGKIAEPGNSPFSLTGQPSACGTAREVGTFAHRLPADMQVTNPEHRAHAEHLLEAPGGHDPGQGGVPRRAAGPDAQGRQAQRLLDPVQQQPPDSAEHQQRDLSGLPQPGELHRCLGPLSDRDHDGGRPDPADRDVGGEGGRVRQRRAAHAHVAPARQRAGGGPLRPVAADGVLQALHHRRGLAGGPSGESARVPRQNPVRRALRQWRGEQVPALRDRPRLREPGVQSISASTSRRACSRSTPASAAATGTTSRRSTPTIRCAACAGRSSTARRRAGATAKATIPTSRRDRAGSSTATPTSGRSSWRLPTSRPPKRPTRSSTSGSSPAGCWSTGTRAR